MFRLLVLMTLIPVCMNAQVYSNQTLAMGIDAVVNNSLFGSGVSFHDFNGDGWDDLSIALETQVKFYANVNGVCTPQTFPFGVFEKGKHPMWVDYDNDGDKDFYLTQYNATNKLFRNDGNNQFTDVSIVSGLADYDTPHFGASWGDYDRDGDLDVYVCNYIYIYLGTDEYNYWDHLYRNNGDGTFTDVTISSGAYDGLSLSFQSVWMDYNNDLWPDIYVINDKEHPNRLYHNNGDGTFTDVATTTNSALTMVDAMTASCGDMNNDGYMDIFVTNTSIGPCALLKNSSTGNFLNIAAPSGTTLSILGWGANWFDYDLDMDQDLYICEYFPQYSQLQNKFMKNQGNETFVNANVSVFPFDFSNSYTSATGDWNQDGYPDLVVSNYAPQNANFWLSGGGSKHSISIALEGVVSNHEGIGAWIHVYAGNEHQVRYTMCGENYMGQDSQYELFGLNDFPSVDSIRVEWPSGHVDHLYNLDADQRLWILEGSGMVNSIISYNNGVLCQGDSLTLDAGDYATFLWDNGNTTRYRTIHEPGTYSVEVSSSFGFLSSAEITIDSVFDPELNFEITSPLCFGHESGSISMVSGILPDSFQWSTDSLGTSISNIPAGEYSLVTNYLNGCTFENQWVLEEPDSLFVHFNVNNVSCAGDSSGSVSIAETNANDFLVLWEITDLDTSQLSAGTYNYELIDDHGCTIQGYIEVNEPAPLNQVYSITNVSCFGGNDGQIQVELLGGSPPYSIDWDNLNPNELSAGAYEVLAYDNNGCVLPLTFDISEPTALSVLPEVLCVDELMTVVLLVNGGIPPYDYLWSDGSGLPEISDIPEESIISVMISDANGCEFNLENITCPVGVENLNKSASFLYPNPFSDVVYLNNDMNNVHSIRILDIQGRLLSEIQTDARILQLNLDFLCSGNYLVKFYSEEEFLLCIQKIHKF